MVSGFSQPRTTHQARFMFLGGPLDHAIREVGTHSGLPPEFVRHPTPEGSLSRVIYHRTRMVTTNEADHGSRTRLWWWVFVATGYIPTPNDILDTMPAHLKELLPS